MSTRLGGVSAAPFDTLNLRPPGLRGDAVDAPEAVAENQRRFAAALGATPVWLDQVHGADVVRLTRADLQPGRPHPRADAAISTEPGIGCAVLVADCLPVLLCDRAGRAVGAAHAGWRGLAGGVVEHTLAALCEAAGCAPDEVIAWLGACIGPRQFEVGADVLEAFGADSASPDPVRFVYRPRPDGAPRWLANLPQLARDRLAAAGVKAISGGAWCTVEQPSRFFSFRRERVTGRQAAAIALRG
ncbi:peptidoglycan editing factor PgeF [Aquincola sp. S2]|uniref:Purine nucleoside phosphorylase n=2 Tax=Pseudaquabacterium terrae TaxID=2732868 RepID=A0ABX2EJX5_9BURK|nr:peptidoglycan editing factor PgeF [Aquabacterium terrae]